MTVAGVSACAGVAALPVIPANAETQGTVPF
jgi:hypothetical protein